MNHVDKFIHELSPCNLRVNVSSYTYSCKALQGAAEGLASSALTLSIYCSICFITGLFAQYIYSLSTFIMCSQFILILAPSPTWHHPMLFVNSTLSFLAAPSGHHGERIRCIST